MGKKGRNGSASAHLLHGAKDWVDVKQERSGMRYASHLHSPCVSRFLIGRRLYQVMAVSAVRQVLRSCCRWRSRWADVDAGGEVLFGGPMFPRDGGAGNLETRQTRTGALSLALTLGKVRK